MERWFTPQERGVILFLLSALILGAIVYIYKLKTPYFAPELKIIGEEKEIELPELIQETETWLESPEPKSKGLINQLPTTSAYGQVNINKASKEELMELPGIGEVYAQRIIDYRERYGGFKSIEEIKRIKGIGEKRFEKLKDKITI